MRSIGLFPRPACTDGHHHGALDRVQPIEVRPRVVTGRAAVLRVAASAYPAPPQTLALISTPCRYSLSRQPGVGRPEPSECVNTSGRPCSWTSGSPHPQTPVTASPSLSPGSCSKERLPSLCTLLT